MADEISGGMMAETRKPPVERVGDTPAQDDAAKAAEDQNKEVADAQAADAKAARAAGDPGINANVVS
jgi:hypothetical protein